MILDKVKIRMRNTVTDREILYYSKVTKYSKKYDLL